MTFLLAGHETTAVLLTWTVYVLTKYPEYQERARQEVSRRKVSFRVCRSKATESPHVCYCLRVYQGHPLLTRLPACVSRIIAKCNKSI